MPRGIPAAGSKTGEAWLKWRAQPDNYTEFCAAIAGGDNLNAWAKRTGIVYNTMRQWIEADPERRALYTQAREDRADFIADEIVAISDELEVRTIIDGKNVVLALDPVAVARNRLRVDTRKWAASKLKPKSYGDRQTVDTILHVTGDDLIAAVAAARRQT